MPDILVYNSLQMKYTSRLIYWNNAIYFFLSFDLLILLCLQDWDFPHFVSAIDIKLPGVNTAHIKFNIPKCLKREVWHVHITGETSRLTSLYILKTEQMHVVIGHSGCQTSIKHNDWLDFWQSKAQRLIRGKGQDCLEVNVPKIF